MAKAAGGRPIDVVADVVGGDVFADLLNVLRPMGRYVTAGAIAGPVVRLDLRTLYLKQLQPSARPWALTRSLPTSWSI
jgi:NADPH:quinone reductase-like Zn-dependent oxidoreductase